MANEVCGELREFNGKVDYSDYVVDRCFMTYVVGGLRSEDVAGTGIQPGMVGRVQRRFIINLEVPPALGDRGTYRTWIAGALVEAADIVRDYLPRKATAYPADRLASDIDSLAERWDRHVTGAG